MTDFISERPKKKSYSFILNSYLFVEEFTDFMILSSNCFRNIVPIVIHDFVSWSPLSGIFQKWGIQRGVGDADIAGDLGNEAQGAKGAEGVNLKDENLPILCNPAK